MTVKELIEELEKVEDKDIEVVIENPETGSAHPIDDLIDGINKYFRKGNCAKFRKCVELLMEW